MIQQSHFWVYTLRKWKEDLKEIFAFHVYSCSIYNSQDMQTTQVSIRGRMDKDVMYTHTSSGPSLSRVRLSATPWTTARQASLSITNTWSLPKLMSIESVMPSSHFILCRPLLLLPSIPPSIRVFSNESALRIRWPHQFSSVPQSCPTLCDPMDWSTPGFSVYHQFLELTQTHVHPVGDSIQPSHPLSSPSPLAPNLSQHQGLFQWVSSSHQVAKVLELQLQHQSFQWIFRTDSSRMDWLDPLAVQGTLKSLLQHHNSKASILWHSAFFIVQLSHLYMTTGKTIALNRWTFVDKVKSLLFNMILEPKK